MYYKKEVTIVNTKMGRPPSKDPKNITVSLRLNEADTKILATYCKDNDVSKTEALREGIRRLEDTPK